MIQMLKRFFPDVITIDDLKKRDIWINCRGLTLNDLDALFNPNNPIIFNNPEEEDGEYYVILPAQRMKQVRLERVMGITWFS